jgi:hypothetical protein
MTVASKLKKGKSSMNMHTAIAMPGRANKRFSIGSRPDPIFAKIEAHRAASQAYSDTCTYEDDFPDEVTREARVQYGMYNDLQGNRTPRYLCSEKEITDAIKRHRASFGDTKFMRDKRKALREGLLAGFRADAVAMKKLQGKSGFTAAAKAYEEASEAKDRAYDSLLGTTPTTAAGMAALADYIAETECMWLDDERNNACFKALKTLARCVLRLNKDGAH